RALPPHRARTGQPPLWLSRRSTPPLQLAHRGDQPLHGLWPPRSAARGRRRRRRRPSGHRGRVVRRREAPARRIRRQLRRRPPRPAPRRRRSRARRARRRRSRGRSDAADAADAQRGRHAEAAHERVHDLRPQAPPRGLGRERVHAHGRDQQDPQQGVERDEHHRETVLPRPSEEAQRRVQQPLPGLRLPPPAEQLAQEAARLARGRRHGLARRRPRGRARALARRRAAGRPAAHRRLQRRL
ncbi:hypothetical protein PUNSTDRAFT_139772, partial [Punctularia strigosozonata HHB-11173 SS5]|uniref:uncharacterized protein n=1 Tax=Punctularia strigosozonata (strain HHB-11173) TaxID=741275 RepID=UPI0004417D8E